MQEAPRKKSFFITFEGVEGTGKTTQRDLLYAYLQEKNIPVIITREPGGTAIAESIRQVLLNHHDEKISPDAELLLMFAARAQHLYHLIRPALERGEWVLCDRFTDATYAYQGGGRKIPFDKIVLLADMIHRDLNPDLTLLFDAPVTLAQGRARQRSAPDRIESEDLHFFERVREAYLDRAKQDPNRFRVIDAGVDAEAVFLQVKEVMAQFIAESSA